MPSKSKSQHNLMAMVAHDKKASKRLGIPQSVGKEYMKADKGKAYAKGGKASLGKLFKGKDTYGEELKEAKAIKSGKISPQQYAKGEKMEETKKPKAYAKGGNIKKPKKMASGGTPSPQQARFQALVDKAAAVNGTQSPDQRFRSFVSQANAINANVPSPQPSTPKVPVSANNSQAVAANIKSNAERGALDREMAKAKFDQISGRTSRPAPVAQAQTGQAQAQATAAQAKDIQAKRDAAKMAAAQQTMANTRATAAQAKDIQAKHNPIANWMAAQQNSASRPASTASNPIANWMAANSQGSTPASASAGMKKGGATKKTSCTKKAKGGCTKMAKGGGVESRGKTKGRFI